MSDGDPAAPARPVRGGSTALLLLAVKVGADAAVGLGAVLLLGPEPGAAVAVAASALGWIPILVLAWLASRRGGIALRWHPEAGWPALAVAGVGLVAIGQAVALAYVAGDATTPLEDAIRTPADLITVVLFAVLVAPVVEEVFFRGYLYGALEHALGAWGAVLVVGLVFGLFHGLQYAGVPAALIAVTVMGLATTWIRKAAGGIWPCIVLHLIYNLVGVGLLLASHEFS